MKIAGGCCKDELCNISAKDALLIVFEIENGKIKTAEEVPFMAGTAAQSADFLVKNEVDLLFAPAMSNADKKILDDAGIHLIDNLCGNLRTLVEAYLAGSLFDNEKYFIKK